MGTMITIRLYRILQHRCNVAHAWTTPTEPAACKVDVNYSSIDVGWGGPHAANPDNSIPAVIVSSNMYANRNETTVLAKSCLDVVKAQGDVRWPSPPCHCPTECSRISSSSRMQNQLLRTTNGTGKLSSSSRVEWKTLGNSRGPSTSKYASKGGYVQTDVVAGQRNGNRNDLTGRVLAYEAIHGAGGAVVHGPDLERVGDKEYDEDDVEYSRRTGRFGCGCRG